MENDELRRLDLLGFDEKTETWFLDTRDARRLMLTRSSLEGLVQLYNTVHSGNPLLLCDRKSLDRLEQGNLRLSETVRDLHLRLDRRRHRRPDRIAALWLAGILRLLLRRGIR